MLALRPTFGREAAASRIRQDVRLRDFASMQATSDMRAQDRRGHRGRCTCEQNPALLVNVREGHCLHYRPEAPGRASEVGR